MTTQARQAPTPGDRYHKDVALPDNVADCFGIVWTRIGPADFYRQTSYQESQALQYDKLHDLFGPLIEWDGDV